jgi:exosortase/archaeosortase family protein
MLEKLRQNPRLYALLKFIVKLNLLSIPLYIVLLLNFDFVELQLFVAQITEYLLHLSGVPAVRDGINLVIPITGGYWSASIVWDCVGWKSMLFFLALVFATDFNRKKYALFFLPIIFIINIARIWFMFFFVYNYGLEYYSFIHTLVWSFGLLFVVIALWLIWIRFIAKKP